MSHEKPPYTPAARPLPYAQRMSLTDEALAGLPEHTNMPAKFKGQSGYWVQAEAVFVPCSSPGTAIAYYRQRYAAGDIATSHNLATAAVGRMKAAQALHDARAERDRTRAALRQVLEGLRQPLVRAGRNADVYDAGHENGRNLERAAVNEYAALKLAELGWPAEPMGSAGDLPKSR